MQRLETGKLALQTLVSCVYVEPRLGIGALNNNMKNLIDQMFALEAEELMWDVLIQTAEAKRFAKFVLKDIQIDKLSKKIYSQTTNKEKKVRFSDFPVRPLELMSKKEADR